MPPQHHDLTATLPATGRVLLLFAGRTLDKPGFLAGCLAKLHGTGGLLGGPDGLATYYANPKSLSWLYRTVTATLAASGLETLPNPLVDRSLETPEDAVDSDVAPIWLDPTTPAGQKNLAARLAAVDWDLALLVYPDAIGLGATAMERPVLATGRPVYATNGRKRLFRLDRPTGSRLALRRFLARSRVMELLLAAVLLGAGAAVRLWERCRQPRENHREVR